MAEHTGPLPEDLYRTIALIRRFEERAMELVKSGDIVSGIHPCIGQEAVAAGIGAALRRDDVMMANHRGHGHLLAKGSDPGRLLAEMAGRVTGVARGRGGSFHPSDFSVGVFGSTGTVGHGAPTAAAGSITARAAAFGIPAATHDGMDAQVVLDATAAAVARARSGEGPAFLEFSTYRYEGHHTFERSVRLPYRDPAEVAQWRARDPMDLQGGRIPAGRRADIDAAVEVALDAAERFALDSPRPDPEDALAYL